MSEVDNTIQARIFMLKSAIFSLADKKIRPTSRIQVNKQLFYRTYRLYKSWDDLFQDN